ncbi:MAG: hypothetical protein QW331_01270 [Candidatus Woesearchaeota archaeon]
MQSRTILFSVLVSIVTILLAVNVAAFHTHYVPLVEKGYYASCEETDSGDDSTKKGIMTLVDSYGHANKYEDICSDFQHVREYSCGSLHPASPFTRKCDLRCVDGACVNSYGKIVSKFSNYLRDVPSTEKQVETKKVEVAKPRPSTRAYVAASSDAIFKRYADQYSTQIECAETDGGYVPGKKGKIMIRYPGNSETVEYEDRCKNWQHVLEYSCETVHPGTPKIHRCDFRCMDGECSEMFDEIVKQKYRGKA